MLIAVISDSFDRFKAATGHVHLQRQSMAWRQTLSNASMSAHRLNRIQLTHATVCDTVAANNGGNDFKMPHMAKQHLEREGELPIMVSLSSTAKDHCQPFHQEADNQEQRHERLLGQQTLFPFRCSISVMF